MPRPDFVHEIEMRVPREELLELLGDLHNYVPLHPLIESIEELPPSDETPRARRYRVVDRVPVGFLRIRTVYTASLERISDHEIHGHAWQSPGIRLHTVYTLTDVRSGTRLSESVSVEAPGVLRRFVVAKARDSHLETLIRMKSLFEGHTGC